MTFRVALDLRYSDNHVPGSAADAYGRRQAVPPEAGEFTGLSTEGAEHGDEGLRLSRCSGSCLHILETVVNRPRSCQGTSPMPLNRSRLLTTCLQAVVLAVRPPITLPRTTVSPGLLEELLGEIPLLASVYHKPAETFVGRGRIGADSMQRKETEYVVRIQSSLACMLKGLAPAVPQTTVLRHRRLSRLSPLGNRRKTYLTSPTTSPMKVNRLASRLRRFSRQHRRLRTCSPGRQATRSTISSLSLAVQTWVPRPRLHRRMRWEDLGSARPRLLPRPQ